jgi:hypothetical protein
MALPLLPLTLIDITILIMTDPIAMEFSIKKLTLVLELSRLLIEACASYYSFLEFSYVFNAVGPYHFTLAILKTLIKLAFVDISVFENQGTFS